MAIYSDPREHDVEKLLDEARAIFNAPEYEPSAILIYVEQILSLRKSGSPKPQSCSWGDWTVKKLSHKHQLLAMKLGQGYFPSELRNELGLKVSRSRLSVLMSSKLFQLQVQFYRGKYHGDMSLMFWLDEDNKYGLKTY